MTLVEWTVVFALLAVWICIDKEDKE